MAELDISALRNQLEERRDDLLREQAGKLSEAGHSADHATPDQMDLATEAAELDLAVTTAFRTGEELDRILGALQRMDAGAYGDCEECGDPIAPKRLEALPFAAYCIECQRLVEERGSETSRGPYTDN